MLSRRGLTSRDGLGPGPAVFLDRDGTINVKAAAGDYITSPEELHLIPGAGRAVRLFNQLGMTVVVVTNQRGVARGLMTNLDLAAITERLEALLAEHGARIDATYTCVHDEGTCDCRKPAPGLLLQALSDRPDIDRGSSVMIGDSESDILAGAAAGMRTVRLAAAGTATAANDSCRDLEEAAHLVASRLTAPASPGRRPLPRVKLRHPIGPTGRATMLSWIVSSDLRSGVRSRVRLALMAAGRHVNDRHLADLRSVLSYLEIGRDLSGRPADEQPLSLDNDTDVFEVARRQVTGQRPLYLEFGVFEGRSLRWWISHLTSPAARFVGFDSFEGLPEDWRPGLETGHFATGQPPDIRDPRVSFVIGWFDRTLPGFAAPPHDQLIINIDSDLYSSAATVLRWATPLLRPGTLLYFDEYPDRDHEMRALAEYARTSPYDFSPVAFARGGVHWLFLVRDRPDSATRVHLHAD